ncbi:MAG: asnB [Gemmatimonadetes bacterium]|nr:asnB [Gemmatimonadota bacterium]
MCGIGGIVQRGPRGVDAAALDAMSGAMRERGPDDHGRWLAPGVGLVHRRLSIVDLSPAGRCPMPNEDGSVQVTFNGEIYNHRQLRERLLARGHRFRSHADTEVLVHGYEEWGDGLVRELDGMFALAVWDAARERLLLARDRAGEKPLYYAASPDRVAFASSLNAVAEALGADREVNPAAIQCYLAHSFIPGPHTAWRGVSALPPAHLAAFERATGRFSVERYWDFPAERPARMGVAQAERAVEEALDGSVRARLAADVPVGAFLSGGVDSSLVVALAARHAPGLSTFALGFDEREHSELPYARRVAKAVGTAHHEVIVREADLLDAVPELVWQYGQPFGDSSAIPTHLLSRFTRGSVKVALSGDGGDESFAGYWRAAAGWYAGIYGRALPTGIRRHVVPRAAGALASVGLGGVGARVSALNELSLARPGAGYTNSESWLDALDRVMPPAARAAAAGHDPVACRTGRAWEAGSASLLQQVLYDDFQVLLPAAYLTKVDVASMAASLEVRAPFLGHPFLEAAWRLPDAMKLRRGRRKWLLKRIAARHVPRDVIYRPKQGFALPMAAWWRGRLPRVLTTLMADSSAVRHGWIEAAPVRAALDEHVRGARDHATRLWLVLWLELWARITVDRSLPRSASLSEFG